MRCTISEICFGKELYMFWTDLLYTIRSLNTVYTAIGVSKGKVHPCTGTEALYRSYGS